MAKPAAAHKRWLNREAGRAGVDLPVPVLPGEKPYLMQAPLLETHTEGPRDIQKPVVLLTHETLPKFSAAKLNIRYRRNNDEDRWTTQVERDPSQDRVKLLELDEGTEYEFQLQTVTPRGTLSEWTASAIIATAKDPYAPEKPEDVRYQGFEPTYSHVSQAKMTWKKPTERDYKQTRVQVRYDGGEWSENVFFVSEGFCYPAEYLYYLNNAFPSEADAFWVRLTHEDFSGNLSDTFEDGPYNMLGYSLSATGGAIEDGIDKLLYGPRFTPRTPPPRAPDEPDDGGEYTPGPDTGGAAPSGDAFLINENFTIGTIPEDAKILYQAAWQFLGAKEDGARQQIVPGSKDSPGGNRVDIYKLRQVRNHLHTAAIMLDATGDVRALNSILSIWNALIAKAETSWYPGNKFGNNSPLEMKGIKRFNYYNSAGKTSATFINQGGYTNHHELENDLHSGYCGEIRYILWRNQEYSPAIKSAYRNVADYHDGLIAQRKLFSKAEYSSKPDYYWGKPLHHPTASRYNEAFFMNEMGHNGWQEQIDLLVGWLADDIDLIDHPGGYKLYNVPHGVQGRYRALSGSARYDGSQDCTYIGEDWPGCEMSCRAGSPLFTPTIMKAIGHTCDMGVFYDGYGASTVGGSIGGGGHPGTTDMRKFLTRTGLSLNTRWKTPENNFREQIHQVQRNLTTVPMWRVMNGEMDAGLVKVNRIAANAERKGPEMARFLAKIGGKLR